MRQGVVDHALADQGADEGRAAADQAEQRREAPGRAGSPRRPAGRRCRNPRWRCAGPKPMISRTASEISPAAAELPIARPSAKLCRPMPMAIISANRLAGAGASVRLEFAGGGCPGALGCGGGPAPCGGPSTGRSRPGRPGRAPARPRGPGRRAAAVPQSWSLSAASVGSQAAPRTSQSRNSRMPIATAFKAGLQPREPDCAAGRAGGRGRW